MSSARCLVLEVRFATEPAAWLALMLSALRPLVDALRPAEMFVCTPGGKVSRDRKVKWSTVEELSALPTTGTLSLHTYEGATRCSMRAYLRHNPAIELRYQRPADVWFSVERTADDWAPALRAAEDFLTFAAAAPSVLFGGITVLDNDSQASSEVTGDSTFIEKQPAQFQARHDHDWRLQHELWTLCRRLYWKTLLGPTLAAAAGGADAARAAGALDLREIDGSLLFQAMPGPPRDSLDPEFLAATTSLRRWLWPHTFKNPLDAAGFEAEVGLPTPSPTLG